MLSRVLGFFLFIHFHGVFAEDAKAEEHGEFKTDRFLKDELDENDSQIEVVQEKIFSKFLDLELYGAYGYNPTNSFESIQAVVLGAGFHITDYFGLNYMYINNNNEDSLLSKRFEENFGVKAEFNSEQTIHAYQIQLTPIYAKLAFFNWKLSHYELFLSPTYAQVTTSAERVPAYGISIGNRFYITNWMNLRAEYFNIWYDDTVTFQTGKLKGQQRTNRVYSGTIMLGLSFLIGIIPHD